jgi:uncharacterized membrane protein YgdD (TMEM256/DUF423 family)
MPRYKIWLATGALLGGLAVALGAFGAHGLQAHFEAGGLTADESHLLDVWDTAAHYQIVHALALLAVGLIAARHCAMAVNVAGAALAIGTLIFSGCLYSLVLSGISIFGAIVPVGGVLMIVGWGALAVAALRLPAK